MFDIQRDSQGIVTINIQNSERSVNVIDRKFIENLELLIDELKNNKDLKGVIFTAEGDVFIAGADLEMILSMESYEDCLKTTKVFHSTLRQLETSGKPMVAAMNGSALGGGLEFALCCHQRLSLDNPKIRFGLPEVTLGLMPGAGGTQRLPRLIGIQNSLPLLLEGKRLSAKAAKEIGLVNEVFQSSEEMIKAAREFILNQEGDVKNPWDMKGYKIPGGGIVSSKGSMALVGANSMLFAKTHGLLLGANKILQVVYEGLEKSIEAGLKIEAIEFSSCVLSDQAKRMVNTLYYQTKRLNSQGEGQNEIKTVGILGGGMMGSGLANHFIASGINVILKDIDLKAGEKAKDYISSQLDKKVKKNRIDKKKKEQILSLFKITDKEQDLKECDLVIEAVTEDRQIKDKVTREISEVIPENSIFASNTSTLPITELSQSFPKTQNFIGMHFFSPVERMPLVELIRGKETSPETISKCLAFLKQVKKTPIVVNDGRGFFTTRVFMTYVLEGIFCLLDGIPAYVIERAGKMGGMPVGPLAVADEVSIDLIYHIIEQTRRDLGDEHINQDIFNSIRVLVEDHGRLGKKNKKGFYDYPENGRKTLSPVLKEIFKSENPKIHISQVVDRLMSIQTIEALRCMDEGIIENYADGDVASILGWGFPPHTGGVFSYAKNDNIDEFEKKSRQLKESWGERFQIPKIGISY